jgi:soluble lytic murein transglycosylase
MKFKKNIICIALLIVFAFGLKLVVTNYLFPFKHKEAILKYSKEYDLDPYLVLSVIKAESKFIPDAHSSKDAMGLMQITGDTADWIAKEMGLNDYSVDKLYEEEYNINMGCWYLSNLREEFKAEELYVAAYNAGRGRVNEWLKDSKYSEDGKTLSYIPYAETKKYVDRVDSYHEIYKYIYE